MVVQVPPLREHPEDIPLLAETFLQRYTTGHKLGDRRFTRDALRQLENYQWPGNVRELSHVVERAVTLCDDEWVDVEDLGFDDAFSPPLTSHLGGGATRSSGSPSQPMFDTFNLDEVTRHLVVAALEKTRGHKSKAASLLGIHPRTLTRMLRRYDLPED
jgi:two-component system response regulator PilR (NtrC family)